MNRSSAPDRDVAVRAAAALLRLMAALVRSGSRDIGVTASLTLVTLDVCGPCRITELAAMEGVSQPSMSGVVAGLERSGLVERRRDPQDRRVVLVAITPAGLRYLQRRRASSVEMLGRLIATLAHDEAEALLATVPVLERLSLQAARQHSLSD